MHRARTTGVRFVVLTGLYLAGAAFALHLIHAPGEVALFWPASGLALAVVVRYGLRWWLWVLSSNLLMHALLDPVPWDFLPFSALSNALGALLGGWWVRRHRLTAEPNVAAGLALTQGAALMAALSGLTGAGGLWLAGLAAPANAGVNFARWAMGDFLSAVALTPLLLSLLRPRSEHADAPAEEDFAPASERLAWLLLLGLTLAAIIAGATTDNPFTLGLAAAPLALLLWSAMRLPPIWTVAGVAVAILSLAAATALGVGGFAQPTQPLETAILLGFLSLIGIAPMLLMAGTYERLAAARTLLRRATTDALTGLPNRAAFEDRMRQLPDGAGIEMRCALAYIDLDHFTLVNDTASHAAGDALIKSLASLLRARLPAGDELFRIGGDEFAAILHDRNAATARALAEDALSAIEDFRLGWHGLVLNATASIGLALFDRHDPGRHAGVLAQADAACFTAKEMGGNRVCVAALDAGETFQRTEAMRWALRIRDGLDQGQFELFCQRISPIAAGAADPGAAQGRHFEVLLRLNPGRDLKLLLPGNFIPAAERFSLCVQIDRHVVAKVLDWFDAHPEALAEVDTCAINLTADSLMDEGFAAFLAERLAASRVEPGKLCFEITETSAVHDLAQARRFIRQMRALGCRFALDDFGTGFSSFGYLRSLEVDFIKIDGSFVREMQSSALSTAVIRSITEIAHVLHTRTIAEHTESAEVCIALRALGVDYAQGHAIHMPEPIEAYFGRPEAEPTSVAEVASVQVRGGLL